MITFKEHIDLFKSMQTENGLIDYLSKLSPEDKINTIRDLQEVYPLKYKPPRKIYKDFNVYDNVMDLVLGQFIMLEQIITGKTKYNSEEENDLAIAQLILRPKQDTNFDNSDESKERINTENILNYDVEEIYGVVTKFLNDRNEVLFKQFSGVFYQVQDETDEEVDEEEVTGAALFEQQWYWYSVVRMLAKEDITRYADIYMLKMDVVMPEMSFLAQKNKIESAENRKRSALNKL